MGFNLDAYLLIKNSILEIEPVYALQDLSDESVVAVQPDMPLLAEILRKAINSISYEEQSEILSKWSWIPEQKKDTVKFSPEEYAWLAAHPVVRVFLDSHWAPVEFRDDKGRYQGIVVDYLKRLEELLGIRLEAAEETSWTEGVEKIRKKELDMIATISKTLERQKVAVFTEPYLSMPVNIFARNDVSYIGNLSNMTNRRAAVLESTAVAEWLARDYPEITQAAVQTTGEGLKMVAVGKVDAFIGNVVTASYYLGKLRLNNVRIAGETPYTYDLSIAVRDDWPIFAGILQKALNSIDQPEREAFFNRWMSIRYEHESDYSLLWKILAIMLIIIGLFFYWNRKLSIEVIQRKQAEEVAKTANRAKSIFLANMSHDLHTPLNAILGFSEIMQQDHSTNSAQQEKLTIINRSADNLLTMIDDILELARVDAGHVQLKPVAFDLLELLQQTEQLFQIHSAGRQQHVVFELSSYLPQYVVMDMDKLRYILFNVINYYLGATEGAEFLLHVRSLSVPHDPVASTIQFELEVKNDGADRSAEQLEHLFALLSLDYSEKISYTDSRPGLMVSKSFIELMGGEVSLSSGPDKTTLLHLNLPATLAKESPASDSKEQMKSTPILKSNQEVWRILIVDDILENRLLLKSLLSQAGFQTYEAENGERAIVLYAEWQPHFIWMDLRMPVLDGYETTRRIRTLLGGDKVKIVAVTAGAFKEEHDKILAAGCNDVLHKPFKAQEIFAIMAKHLEVRYCYPEEKQKEKALSSVPLTADMVATLPAELQDALRRAAYQLDIAGTKEAIQKICKEHPETGESLLKLAHEFRFGRILELLNER